MPYYIFSDPSISTKQRSLQPGDMQAPILREFQQLNVEIWEQQAQGLKRADVYDGSGIPSFTMGTGETALDVFKRNYSARFPEEEGHSPWNLQELRLKPGEYYPRIARPSCYSPNESPGICPDFDDHREEFASLAGQLSALIRRLQQICSSIHPCESNYTAYGHEIRNLLILASTEVETHWRAILEANHVVSKGTFYTTCDYAKLLIPLALGQYKIAFPNYPWLKPIAPFSTWAIGQATQSLKWYAAYNGVKHDREKHFSQANLENVLSAVAACGVMLCAQFGNQNSFRQYPDLDFLQVAQCPVWSFAEVYVPPLGTGSQEWSAVDYPF